MPMDKHYLGHRKRLKARLAENSQGLADYEVMELLLGYALPRRDTKQLAKEMLTRFGSLRGIYYARPNELEGVPGMSSSVIVLLDVWREFWGRVQEGAVQERHVFSHPRTVADFAIARLGHELTEQFWVALVDNKNRLVQWRQVSRGTVDQTPVYPREILRMVLHHQASGLILVHNHPGGDPKPSIQDQELTRKMQRAAQEMDIRVLDHIIVTESDYFSFQAQGLL
ncbi:DNA repair protein RadC [Desulfonatronum thiosulfatophilum]|uniref:DNA repair protein RadC n=1 Tax=Desulfonatronum thiosulfatophilum TaxID=617002 RepID=A0A1G6DWF8_9BACT|nr:DNA repair protein RadC [Desulfonatronum thiosulfatophilum]SDB49471.1 DNA repair protein RadC [Desulfonatronum thiosulfatophilum]